MGLWKSKKSKSNVLDISSLFSSPEHVDRANELIGNISDSSPLLLQELSSVPQAIVTYPPNLTFEKVSPKTLFSIDGVRAFMHASHVYPFGTSPKPTAADEKKKLAGADKLYLLDDIENLEDVGKLGERERFYVLQVVKSLWLKLSSETSGTRQNLSFQGFTEAQRLVQATLEGKVQVGSVEMDATVSCLCAGAAFTALCTVRSEEINCDKDALSRMRSALEMMLGWESAQPYKCTPGEAMARLVGHAEELGAETCSKAAGVFMVDLLSTGVDDAEYVLLGLLSTLTDAISDFVDHYSPISVPGISVNTSTYDPWQGKGLWLPDLLASPQAKALLKCYGQAFNTYRPTVSTLEGISGYTASMRGSLTFLNDYCALTRKDQIKDSRLPGDIRLPYKFLTLGVEVPAIISGEWKLMSIDEDQKGWLSSMIAKNVEAELVETRVVRSGICYESRTNDVLKTRADQAGAKTLIVSGGHVKEANDLVFINANSRYTMRVTSRRSQTDMCAEGVIINPDAAVEAIDYEEMREMPAHMAKLHLDDPHQRDKAIIDEIARMAAEGMIDAETAIVAATNKNVPGGTPSTSSAVRRVWRVYCPKSDLKMVWRMQDGTDREIPYTFCGEDDIDSIVSYRWRETTSDSLRSPSFEKLMHLPSLAGKKKVWVDCVAHNGDKKILQIVLQSMPSLYEDRADKVALTYYEQFIEEEVSLTHMLEDASRIWTFQEQYFASLNSLAVHATTSNKRMRVLLAEMVFSLITGRKKNNSFTSPMADMCWAKLDDYVALYRNGNWSQGCLNGLLSVRHWIVHYVKEVKDALLKAPPASGDTQTPAVPDSHSQLVVFDPALTYNHEALMEASLQVSLKVRRGDDLPQVKIAEEEAAFSAAVGYVRADLLASVSNSTTDVEKKLSVMRCMTSTCFANPEDLTRATTHLLGIGHDDHAQIRAMIEGACRSTPEGMSRPVYTPIPGLCNPTGLLASGKKAIITLGANAGQYVVSPAGHKRGISMTVDRCYKKYMSYGVSRVKYSPIAAVPKGEVLVQGAGEITRGDDGLACNSIVVQSEDMLACLRSVGGPIPTWWFSVGAQSEMPAL